MDDTVADGIAEAEVLRFWTALAARGPGASVVVHDQAHRTAWRKHFRRARKLAAIKYEPTILIDKTVPEGSIQIVDVDDRSDAVQEAIESEGIRESVSEGGIILPGGTAR